ncbi:MAG: tetratricopeptide repeat protein [Marinibacterium sp.]|nr:tetratricopeptide repeat protein [Marinibacterium sp.]
MREDRYGNPLTTQSDTARDAYVRGVDLLLGGDAGVEDAFEAAIAADDGFALAHLGLARAKQGLGKGAEIKAPLKQSRALASGVTVQETGAIDALGLMLEGKGALAYPKIRAHVDEYPRDALVAQTCMGVFGLIGFSGQAGRESEQLAYARALAPHYGDDWWFLCQLAFAELEVGQLETARRNIDRSQELCPSAAHGVHVKSHLLYESGETDEGIALLTGYHADLNRTAQLHCHLSWHLGLWSLETGNLDKMWAIIDQDISPEVSLSPPLNILTDTAALLARAELRGVSVPEDYWHRISTYASERFPHTGIAFADVHAAMAHAMAGQGEALHSIVSDAKGPAAEVVCDLAEGFGAFARGDWARAVAAFTPAMSRHERIGGSRAQRDLLEMAMTTALLRQGQGDEARRFLATRRPETMGPSSVAGLAG